MNDDDDDDDDDEIRPTGDDAGVMLTAVQCTTPRH